MFKVAVNKEKNRLYIDVGDLQNRAEFAKIVNKIKEKCQNLAPGFTCINDLRAYKELHDEKYETFIEEAQQAMVDAGLSKVVRVVKPFNKLGHMQLDKISMKVGYHARNVTSMEEAEAILDGLANRNDSTAIDLKQAG